jgi:hypothetical protein
MLTIAPQVRDYRAVLEFSQTGSGSVVIEHVFVSRSRTFAAGRLNDVLIGALMNVGEGEHKYLDLTDSLLQLFGQGALIEDVVWIAFVLKLNPVGQRAIASLRVEVRDGKITRFEPFSSNN